MTRYRIVTNGRVWRIQSREYWWWFWHDAWDAFDLFGQHALYLSEEDALDRLADFREVAACKAGPWREVKA